VETFTSFVLNNTSLVRLEEMRQRNFEHMLKILNICFHKFGDNEVDKSRLEGTKRQHFEGTRAFGIPIISKSGGVTPPDMYKFNKLPEKEFADLREFISLGIRKLETLADEETKYFQSRKWTDSSAARSSEGKNHDTEISPITSELPIKGLQSRKWTDSTAARSSEGKNHDTELSPISSGLLDYMDKFLLLMGLLTMFHFINFGISQIGVIYLVLLAAVLNEMKSITHSIAQQKERMNSWDKKLHQSTSKTSADIDSLRAQVGILQKKPKQNIFTQRSKQVNFIVNGVEIEELSDKMSKTLHGVSHQQFRNNLHNEIFGIDKDYENLPVLTRRNTSTDN